MDRSAISIVCSFIAVLMIAAAPLVAQAGTVTIHNDNCTTLKDFKTHKWVRVHVDSIQPGSTNKWVKLGLGESEKISLRETYKLGGKRLTYYYVHEAAGTAGDNDVSGKEDSSVTCRKETLNICNCRKDWR